jgi:hypothetical protein
MVDPISIVTLALSIAKATGLTDWVSRKLGGVPSVDASKKIIDIAVDVVGEEEVKGASFSKEDAATIKELILQHESELVRINLADKKNARSMYKSKNTQADRVANSIMRWNLPAIVMLIIGNGAAVYYIENPAIAVAIGNIIGASISFLWQERQQIVGFFFGSSIGSKAKDSIIKQRHL